MRGYLAVTDPQWLETLREVRVREANFWQPRPTQVAQAPGTPWLFKVRGADRIAGYGIFSYYTVMPLSVAWETFERGNGVASHAAMLGAIERLRRTDSGDDRVGCVVLPEIVILTPDDYIAAPSTWHRNTVRGAYYDLSSGEGLIAWQSLLLAAVPTATRSPLLHVPGGYGEPALVQPRRGQGAFRLMVMDAYDRRCAITGERTLPALEAAHIRPFSEDATHEVSYGILMRGDLHRLYDRGYVTIEPDLTFKVSPAIERTYHNGRIYYALDGQRIVTPKAASAQPDREALSWHAKQIFRP